jgi:uncharacterized protein YbgA (DUF1722 family)/uncharacterized protein YbbK (DUF523 family)
VTGDAPVQHPPADEVRIGVSACLLGENVRFDGGHRRDRFLTDTLARFVTFVPVCPEVELGLGTPRETLRLVSVASDGPPRLVAPASGADHTDGMARLARERVAGLEAQGLWGYITKKDSPTCGLERVRVYDRNDVPARRGVGLFAAALLAGAPLLPVEEDGRLQDPRLRENFFERVFAYGRLRALFGSRWTAGDLVAFHTREKLLLMAHAPAVYRRLGQLVAAPHAMPREELARTYQETFMTGLRTLATKGRHVNALQHMQGFVSDALAPDERAELEGVIADFGHGLVPLVVPLTLLRHHVRKQKVEWLSIQTYLDPHPKELMLRNHA